MAQKQTTTSTRVAQALGGIIVIGAAGWCVEIDVSNNAQFGATISPEMASVMTIGALGVASIPIIAKLMGGWKILSRIGMAVALAMTVAAAIAAYTKKQGDQILEAQKNQGAYAASQKDQDAARADAASARAELARITETALVDDLRPLVTAARTKVEELTKAARENDLTCTQSKGNGCRAAEEILAKLNARMIDAGAKSAAHTRLAYAEDQITRAKLAGEKGPAEAAMWATMIATYTGANANDVARIGSMGLTCLGIVLTQVIAYFGHVAIDLFSAAFARSEPTRKLTKKGSPAPKPRKKSPVKKVSNVVSLDAARDRAEKAARKKAAIEAIMTRNGPDGHGKSLNKIAIETGVSASAAKKWAKEIEANDQLAASVASN
jgi:DNA-binding transcriptional regulator YhcF (GntR family)